MRCLLLLLVLASCKRDHVRPVPKQAVFVKRLPPVVGETFDYAIDDKLEISLVDDTRTLELSESIGASAREVVTRVERDVAMERTIQFERFAYRPLGATAESSILAGKTYRWDGKAASASSDELAALKAYARRDTGEPDVAIYLLTERDFVEGEPWTIAADQPAPFAHGKHDGTKVTFVELANRAGAPHAVFDIEQRLILEPMGQRVPIDLHGRIAVDIGRARIVSIDVDGAITERTGPVAKAHVESHQQFIFDR